MTSRRGAAPATAAAISARRRPAPRGRRPRRSLASRLARAPLALRLALLGVLVLAALAALNVAYQVASKPTELLGLVFAPAPLTPAETWARYGSQFRAHATDLVRAELLAALAHAESQGDPLARTAWQWRWTWNPFALYAPASSAVGLFQMTDAAFAEGRQLCVHDHRVARAGSWYDPHTCWFPVLYMRTVPGHAIEMTAARLHEHLVLALGPERAGRVGVRARERLAAVIHLCGPARGAAFVRRGFRVAPGELCGTHDLAAYLARVDRFTLAFERLARAA
ncbi:MAG TPA: lytic transglycosylase domain-containing protein [Methylomirabilota bacterium]